MMPKTKVPFPKVLFSLISTFALISLLLIPARINAQFPQVSRLIPNNAHEIFMQQIYNQDLTNRGAPEDDDKREGTSTRGETFCKIDPPVPVKEQMLTALVPVQQKPDNEKEYVFGLTVKAYPHFWFYIPYKFNPGLQATFDFKNKQGDSILGDEPITINLSQIPGIISFALPATKKGLEIGEIYRWEFILKCRPNESSADVTVTGKIKRVAASPNQNAGTPREQVARYVRDGIWYEALTTLAEEIRSANLSDPSLDSDWNALLEAIDLQYLSKKPLVSCCE